MTGPRALVLSPATRDRVIERLQDHFARSHIDVAELERRIELAEHATSDAALTALLADLPSLDTAVVVAKSATASATAATAGRVTSSIYVTFSATTRRGRWRVPLSVKVRVIFGSVDLDLCDAELERGETVFDVSVVCGSVLITVPEGLAVECEGSAILGSFDHHAQSAASKRDPRRVRIVGKVRLGAVDVVIRKKTGMLEEIKSTVRGLLGG